MLIAWDLKNGTKVLERHIANNFEATCCVVNSENTFIWIGDSDSSIKQWCKNSTLQ